jgi:site-specific recombinase XerD
MRERGAELDMIRDRLGHESLPTAEIYTHAVLLNQTDQTDAAELIADL